MSKLDTATMRFEANHTGLLALLGAMRAEEERIREGGGAKAAEAGLKAKGIVQAVKG